jgi:hypothetical protein
MGDPLGSVAVKYRWLTNLGLMLLGGTVLSVIFPAAAARHPNAATTHQPS